MHKYNLGENYQWHFTCEEDRPWLEEAMVRHRYATPDIAISMNENLNETSHNFRFSIIGSHLDQNILWIAQKLVKPEAILSIIGIAIHPLFRNQNYIRNMGYEYIEWLKSENRWGIRKLEIITQATFSAGRDLFGGPWSETIVNGMKNSIIRLEDL